MRNYPLTNPVIHVENLSKRYRIGMREEQPDTMAGNVMQLFKQPLRNLRYLRNLAHFGDGEDDAADVFWALKNVSFEVQQGEVLGIIGRNGAGKSTLLKILSRITEPSSGQARMRGRVASLLEVGTGFNPELTGRENMYLNGTILGMRKAEIDRKFDEIVDFAGVEKFIDTPVKRYSSGMKVRLGFAVAAHLEPEIMIVDEVLAVGDAAFQKKCLGKMDDVARGGRTVLFVSHNMGAVSQLCRTCIWLEHGAMQDRGETSAIVADYLKSSDASMGTGEAVFAEDPQKPAQIRRIRVLDAAGEVTQNFDCDHPITIEVTFQLRHSIPGLYGFLSIAKIDGVTVLVSDSFDAPPNPLDELNAGMYTTHVTIPARLLGHGEYTVTTSLACRTGSTTTLDTSPVAATFHLDDFTTQRGNNRRGVLSTLLRWDVRGEMHNQGATY